MFDLEDGKWLRALELHLRHHFRFFDEIVLGHRTAFHHFDGRVNGATPFAAPDDAKLSGAQLLKQHQFGRMNFPFVVRQAGRWRYRTITR